MLNGILSDPPISTKHMKVCTIFFIPTKFTSSDLPPNSTESHSCNQSIEAVSDPLFFPESVHIRQLYLYNFSIDSVCLTITTYFFKLSFKLKRRMKHLSRFFTTFIPALVIVLIHTGGVLCQPPRQFRKPCIAHGNEAMPHEFIWQVSLQHFRILSISWQHICAGAVIADEWVVTAAHCINIWGWWRRIVLGTIDLDKNKQIASVSYILQHPKYRKDRWDYDVALIQFKPRIDFKVNSVQPLRLPGSRSSTFFDGFLCLVAGWGNDWYDNKGYSTRKLRKIAVRVISEKNCRRWDPSMKIITSRVLCAMPAFGGSTCSGDSGGPLACYKKGIGFTIAGIVSFGTCSVHEMPIGFTRITSVLSWIEALTIGTSKQVY